MLDGGYVCAGPVHGYAWTSPGEIPGAKISPPDFGAVKAGETLCVKGFTAYDYSSVGILGVNAGHEYGSARVGSWAPTGSGIDVTVSMTGTFVLRIVVKTTTGEEYCAAVTNGANSLSWSDLTTACWEPGNPPYNGKDPIAFIGLLVPGTITEQTAYDFCLEELNIH